MSPAVASLLHHVCESNSNSLVPRQFCCRLFCRGTVNFCKCTPVFAHWTDFMQHLFCFNFTCLDPLKPSCWTSSTAKGMENVNIYRHACVKKIISFSMTSDTGTKHLTILWTKLSKSRKEVVSSALPPPLPSLLQSILFYRRQQHTGNYTFVWQELRIYWSLVGCLDSNFWTE